MNKQQIFIVILDFTDISRAFPNCWRMKIITNKLFFKGKKKKKQSGKVQIECFGLRGVKKNLKKNPLPKCVYFLEIFYFQQIIIFHKDCFGENFNEQKWMKHI